MNCKICYSISSEVFKAKVLNQYSVVYFQCPDCQFIQTESPFWLSEAYHSAITDLDIGLIQRNIQFSDIVESILLNNSIDSNRKFIERGNALCFENGA